MRAITLLCEGWGTPLRGAFKQASEGAQGPGLRGAEASRRQSRGVRGIFPENIEILDPWFA